MAAATFFLAARYSHADHLRSAAALHRSPDAKTEKSIVKPYLMSHGTMEVYNLKESRLILPLNAPAVQAIPDPPNEIARRARKA